MLYLREGFPLIIYDVVLIKCNRNLNVYYTFWFGIDTGGVFERQKETDPLLPSHHAWWHGEWNDKQKLVLSMSVAENRG